MVRSRHVLLAGVAVAIVAFAVGALAGTRDGREAIEPDEAPSTVDPAVLAVVTTFVRTAVARRNTGASFELVDPELRGTMSRAQWATGNIPVVNYPASQDIVVEPRYTGPDDVLLDVTLTPHAHEELEPLTFAIGLRRTPGSPDEWRVYYWMPQYDPPSS